MLYPSGLSLRVSFGHILQQWRPSYHIIVQPSYRPQFGRAYKLTTKRSLK